MTRATGEIVVDRVLSLERVRIPRAVSDSARNHFLATPGPYGIQPERRAAVRQLRVPEYYPPVRDVIVGQDRTIWLGRWPNDTDPRLPLLRSIPGPAQRTDPPHTRSGQGLAVAPRPIS